MKYVDVSLGEPGPDEVLIAQKACGLNYIDIYFRSGYYPQPLPGGIGMEASGVIEKVGPGVTHLKVGDRVAYAGRPTGAYAQARIMPAETIVQLPDAISFETGAGMMLQEKMLEFGYEPNYHENIKRLSNIS